MPSINGPAALAFIEGPPWFNVDPGENGFYAVEVTSSAELFDWENHGNERDESNFYASWENFPLLSHNPYDLPQEAWERLASDADRLYYRVWTSGSDTQWVNPETSTRDEEARDAPFITVLRDTGPNEDLRVLLAYLGFSYGYFVTHEQRYFGALGERLRDQGIIGEDEFVDRETFREAVRAFQEQASLSADGIPGEDTLWALQEEWAQNRNLEIQRVEADVWIRPGLPDYVPARDGYDHFMLREDAAQQYEAVRGEVVASGGIVTSAGAFRDLRTPVTAGRSSTSMHYSGLAFDLALPTGMQDPEVDPFIITQEDDQWRVWARANFWGTEQTLQAVVWQDRSTFTQEITASVIDFTALAEVHGFRSIRPRSCFPETYTCAEWWHFQWEEALVPGISQFGIELLSLSMYSESDLSAASDVWANKKRIFKRARNGWY